MLNPSRMKNSSMKAFGGPTSTLLSARHFLDHELQLSIERAYVASEMHGRMGPSYLLMKPAGALD
jgi:hypothetical protein